MYENGHNFATGLPIDVIFGSRVGFPTKLRWGLHTGTAVARNPCVSWAFLFIDGVVVVAVVISCCYLFDSRGRSRALMSSTVRSLH